MTCKFAAMCRYHNADSNICAQEDFAITSCKTYVEFEQIIDLKRQQYVPLFNVIHCAQKSKKQ